MQPMQPELHLRPKHGLEGKLRPMHLLSFSSEVGLATRRVAACAACYTKHGMLDHLVRLVVSVGSKLMASKLFS